MSNDGNHLYHPDTLPQAAITRWSCGSSTSSGREWTRAWDRCVLSSRYVFFFIFYFYTILMLIYLLAMYMECQRMPMPITSCQRATGSGEGSGKSRGQKFKTDRVGLALLLGRGGERGGGRAERVRSVQLNSLVIDLVIDCCCHLWVPWTNVLLTNIYIILSKTICEWKMQILFF